MPTIITDEGLILTTAIAVPVQLKASLDDADWSTEPHLYCDKLTLAVNAYDEAFLSVEIGDMVQPGEWSYLEWPPVEAVGKYCRLVVPQDDPLPDIEWVGYIVSDAKERSAVDAFDRLTGKKQVLRAVGLEYFLDRVQIDSAVVYDTTRIFRSIPFNGGKGVGLDADTRTRANRSPLTNADGAYVFVGSGDEGELWTLANMVHYLCEYFTTKNTADSPFPTSFRLDPQDALDGVLDGISPTLNVEGMTPFQVLNKILAPQRGFVWWAEFSEPFPGNHEVRIRVETLAVNSITLPTTGTIPANRDQQSLDFDQQRDVDDVIIVKAGSRRYHQIIVRGARMTGTGTWGRIGEATGKELKVDWESAIETEYDAATDAARKSERFYRVYSAFRIDPEWDGKTGDGGAGARNWTFPELSPTGSIIDTLPWSVEGLRLLNRTRLKRGWDYADTANIEETTPAGSEAEYMPLFGILQVATSTEKYQFVEKIRKSTVEFAGSTAVSSKITTSYTISPQQTVPGIILNSHGLNHTAALNHWVGAAASEVEPQVDYETLRVTCTIEADSYCEGKWPADADLPAATPLEKLIIYAGDEYRLDFLAANTVVDLDDGDPVLTNGGILRDDRKSCSDIARVAFEWYTLERLPMTVTFRQTRNLFRLGMLISAIGSGTTQENVNTVVSIVDYDFANGTMTIKTNDSDLDLVKVA